MPILLSIISSFLFLMSQTFIAKGQQLQKEMLYPWKTKSGLIGYSNQDGQIKIHPQFEDARLFNDQFAIIQKDGKKGVIDKKGNVKVACQYEEIQLAAAGDETLVITRKKYNAWWKANQWKIFPGFSIMGSTRDKRFFDTNVPEIKWEVILLSNNKTLISSDHRPDEYPYQTSDIHSLDDKILINDKLYRINKGKIKQISGVFRGFLTDSTLLRQNGNLYKKLDKDLKSPGDAVFQVPEQIIIKVNGHQQKLKTVSSYSGVKVKLDFMEDQYDRIFLYPDLKKIFPKQISKYFDQHIEADAIIGNAQMICSVLNTEYFIIYSIINNNKNFYILHQDGTWENDRKRTGDFTISSNSGNLMYPTAVDLGIDNFLPQDFEVKRIERTHVNKHWFAVNGISKSDSLPRSGIFDSANKKWVLQLVYTSLEEMKVYPYIWKFELKNENDYKKKKYGLIDVNTRRIIITPKYNTLNADAMAGIFNGEKWENFYINPITGKEFRE